MSKDQARPYDVRCLDALSVARAYIRREAPYYSTIVYGLIPHFADGFGTLAVTKGMALIIDPKWFVEMEKETSHLSMPREEATYKMQAGVLVHEAGHILRGMDRLDAMVRGGSNRDLVNKGFDIPINDDIRDQGWLLPAWAIYADTFGFPKGLTGEQYVEMLTEMEQKQSQKLQKILEKLKLKSGDGEGDSQVAAGKCGGCAGNDHGEIEDTVDVEVGRPKIDQQRIRKEALIQVKEAIGRGNIPNSLKELLDKGDTKPIVPWRTRLRRTIRRASGRIQAGRADFSIRRPSKRSYTRGVIRPGMIDKKPVIFCVEDSSGSMGLEQLRSVRAEITGIFQQLGIAEMWFCDIDAGVAVKPKIIHMSDLAKLAVHGRGGTDFRPGIEIARTLTPKPDILIYLTDGDGPAPATPPKDLTVVWCIVPTPHGRRPAHWGELVVVSDDQKLLEPYNFPD